MAEPRMQPVLSRVYHVDMNINDVVFEVISVNFLACSRRSVHFQDSLNINTCLQQSLLCGL